MSESPSFRHTQPPSAHNVVDRVIADLTRGLTLAQCARHLQLPQPFIEQVALNAQQRGKLTIYDLTGACSSSCQPDSSSLICAACPMAPRTGARKAGLRSLMHALLRPHSSTNRKSAQ